MKLERKASKSSKDRKMVHIHNDTHSKIQILSLETGKPINELVELLLSDALSRVELVDSKGENNNG